MWTTMHDMQNKNTNLKVHNNFIFFKCPILQKKLADSYKATTDYAIIKVDQAFVYQSDLASLCPEALLTDEIIIYPWLTDDVSVFNLYVFWWPQQY